jgi:hypothetical protein
MDGYPLPWAHRPVEGRVLTKMPHAGSNRGWLHEHLGDRIQPEHRGKGVWAIARPISRLENGRTSPALDVVFETAVGLDVAPIELFRW